MSRIRTVKPELFKHDELFDAEINHQLPLRIAFIGLFTCCDREGRFKWHPRRLKTDILPYDAVDAEQVFNTLAQYGFIKKYEYQGQAYGYIPSWHQHQHINNRESASLLPAPLNDNIANEIMSDNTLATTTVTTELTITTPPEEINAKSALILTTPAVLNTNLACTRAANIQQIFNHWKIIMDHPNAQVDLNRQELINKALNLGYDVNNICYAITGCSLTPYNMGKNDRGERYDGLHVILRDANQIDRFISHYYQPPQPPTVDNITQNNAKNIQLWLTKKTEELQHYASR
jgi:hypothetical protein